MQSHLKKGVRKLAAFSVAAFVLLCLLVALPSRAQASTKEHSKGQKALKKADYPTAEKIFRDLLIKDLRDSEAPLGLRFALPKQPNLKAPFDNGARVIMIEPLSARAHALMGASIL